MFCYYNNYSKLLYPAVWLLQATNSVHIQWWDASRSTGRGLLPVEQCPEHPVLPVQLMQGRRDGAGAPGLAQDLRAQRHRARLPHMCVCLRVLRLQKRPPLRVRVPIRGKPHVQDQPTLGLLLVLSAKKNKNKIMTLFFLHFLISEMKTHCHNLITRSKQWSCLFRKKCIFNKKRGCFFYFDVHNCIIMLDCFFINGVLHTKDNLVMTQPIYILLQNLSLFSFICCDFVNTFLWFSLQVAMVPR
jgi:hypothetical protein